MSDIGTDLFELLEMDPNDPHVRRAMADAKDVERLIDSLIELRARRGVTQKELAVRMETTQSAVSKFEQAGGDPRLSTLQRYARAVGARIHLVVEVRQDDGALWWESTVTVPLDRSPEDSDAEAVPVRISKLRLVS